MGPIHRPRRVPGVVDGDEWTPFRPGRSGRGQARDQGLALSVFISRSFWCRTGRRQLDVEMAQPDRAGSLRDTGEGLDQEIVQVVALVALSLSTDARAAHVASASRRIALDEVRSTRRARCGRSSGEGEPGPRPGHLLIEAFACREASAATIGLRHFESTGRRPGPCTRKDREMRRRGQDPVGACLYLNALAGKASTSSRQRLPGTP